MSLLQPGEQLIETTTDADEAVRWAINYRLILKRKARKNPFFSGWEVHTRNLTVPETKVIRGRGTNQTNMVSYYAVIAIPPKKEAD